MRASMSLPDRSALPRRWQADLDGKTAAKAPLHALHFDYNAS